MHLSILLSPSKEQSGNQVLFLSCSACRVSGAAVHLTMPPMQLLAKREDGAEFSVSVRDRYETGLSTATELIVLGDC